MTRTIHRMGLVTLAVILAAVPAAEVASAGNRRFHGSVERLSPELKDRTPKQRGMLYRDGVVARAMRRTIGWEWAGSWSGARDYQHFSPNGS